MAGPTATPPAPAVASEPTPTPTPPPAPMQAAAAPAPVVETVQAPATHAAPLPGARLADDHAAAKPAPLARTSGNDDKNVQDAPAQAQRQRNADARSADGLPSPFKVVSPKQRSANLYRQAIESIQQSRTAEAQQALRQSLAADSSNDDARLLLAELLANGGSNGEAITLLRAGLDGASGQRAGSSGLAMALARLQVADGARTEALATLEHGLAGAADDAEYHAFLAALLQGQGRHAEAAQHYITALRSDPAMPNWLVGVGISLQAENKLSDAREAFQRAIDTEELSPEVAQFANERLQQLRRVR
ncbi:MAG: tetratricopeptide repeat protein [Proteobacteria bacterium]|nr:tetratricopeptide repeat protein [Pseudomonadota bacterium]